MKHEKKTNVMRILDKAGIVYETKDYEYDENDLSGVHAAEALSFDPDMVFKTMSGETALVRSCSACLRKKSSI